MATTLNYTVAAFVPFTKIRSADVNTYFTDIRSRLNWAGSTDATTGLGDDNIQSNTASGGALTRSTKLKAGTASYVVINDASGFMSEEATLALSRGGTGLSIVPASQSPGDVVQINAAGTALSLGPVSTSAPVKIYNFYRFK